MEWYAAAARSKEKKQAGAVRRPNMESGEGERAGRWKCQVNVMVDFLDVVERAVSSTMPPFFPLICSLQISG